MRDVGDFVNKRSSSLSVIYAHEMMQKNPELTKQFNLIADLYRKNQRCQKDNETGNFLLLVNEYCRKVLKPVVMRIKGK